MRILNLGCGKDKYSTRRMIKLDPKDDVVGLDMLKLDGVDVVHDLNKLPLPFKDESFDIVYSAHVLEHLDDVDALCKDIHRILKPNGKMIAIVPHHTNPCAYSHHHKKYWSMTSFDSIENTRTISNMTMLFKVCKKIKLLRPFGWLEHFANRFPDFYEWRLSGFIPAIEIHFELKKVIKK